MSPQTTYSPLENLALAAAICVFGLMAGFFGTYTFNVNLAMLQVDGPTYATVQSLLNQHVRHAGFFAIFFGAGFVSVLALAINYKHRRTNSFKLLALAALIYIAGIIFFTREVNLPLNAITEAWNPAALPSNWFIIRDQWNQANALRVAFSIAAFALSLYSLLLRALPMAMPDVAPSHLARPASYPSP
jgi:uncharacterized membrane protein